MHLVLRHPLGQLMFNELTNKGQCPTPAVCINQLQWRTIKPQQTTLHEVLIELELFSVNVAVAVNNHIISQPKWPDYLLQENDQINVFGAIAGG